MHPFYSAPVEALPAGVLRAFLHSWRGPRYVAYVPRYRVVPLMQQVFTRVRRNIGQLDPLRKHPARVLCGPIGSPCRRARRAAAGCSWRSWRRTATCSQAARDALGERLETYWITLWSQPGRCRTALTPALRLSLRCRSAATPQGLWPCSRGSSMNCKGFRIESPSTVAYGQGRSITLQTFNKPIPRR